MLSMAKLADRESEQKMQISNPVGVIHTVGRAWSVWTGGASRLQPRQVGSKSTTVTSDGPCVCVRAVHDQGYLRTPLAFLLPSPRNRANEHFPLAIVGAKTPRLQIDHSAPTF